MNKASVLFDAGLNGIGHAGIDFIRIVLQFKRDGYLAGVGDLVVGDGDGRHILFGYFRQFTSSQASAATRCVAGKTLCR